MKGMIDSIVVILNFTRKGYELNGKKSNDWKPRRRQRLKELSK